MTQPPQTPTIYQLRLVLAGISPMIWRRLLVSSETNIAQLHQYIQVAFDWSGEHLHRFHIHGKDYGIAYLGGISFDDNPQQGAALSFPPTRKGIIPLRVRLYSQLASRYSAGTILPGDQDALCRFAWAEEARHRAKNMRAPWRICNSWTVTATSFPFEELGKMAKAIRRWLDAGGAARRSAIWRNSGRRWSA